MLRFLFLSVLFVSGGLFAASDSKECDYNEFSGELLGEFNAHKPKEARGWVPLRLRICKNEKGIFYISSHKAVGLGVLSNPPLVSLDYDAGNEDLERGVLLRSRVEDDRNAVLLLEGKELKEFKIKARDDIELVIIAGTSASQITVFRKELSRIYSNTLFGKMNEASKPD